jgi:hypothetical protein
LQLLATGLLPVEPLATERDDGIVLLARED